jgi:hypothetical protein
MTDIEHYLADAWRSWTNEPAYLRLGEEYLTDCPPLWIIGGQNVADSATPLVLISLEPLQNPAHYAKQVAFASVSPESYQRWQLEYFEEFPRLAGEMPQAYWKAIGHLVSGFANDLRGSFCWDVLDQHYVELPFVPLHAKRHRRAQFSAAAEQLKHQLFARLQLVVKRWPTSIFLAAGAAVADALGCTREVYATAETLDLPRESPSFIEAYGARFFWKPIAKHRVMCGESRLNVFVRRAPFSQGHQPRAAGLRKLGELLR